MRIAIAAVGFLSIFFAPAWVTLIVGVVLSMRYPAWEVILMGALLDVMWFPTGGFIIVPLGTLLALLIVWACEPLRRELLVGDKG